MPEPRGPSADRARGQLLAATAGRIGPGHDGDHLVPGGEQRVKDGDGDVRGAGEDDAHRRSLEARRAAGSGEQAAGSTMIRRAPSLLRALRMRATSLAAWTSSAPSSTRRRAG